jgi:hypothetical protein
MRILVDYENLPVELKRRGAVAIADKILTVLGPKYFTAKPRANFRFYGGWYAELAPTRRAQEIAADLQASFPRILRLADQMTSVPVSISAELAYGIEAHATHLFYTFRSRNAPSNLDSRVAAEIGCTQHPCFADALKEFLDRGRCPYTGCSFKQNAILFRQEQKLVDVMIAVDVAYSSIIDERLVCLVTSDDDCWPAILYAASLGVHVIHVHTKPGQSTKSAFRTPVAPVYTELRI